MPSRFRSLVRVAAALFLLAAGAPLARAQSMFSHQIPLKLPKGANGMQPDLVLQYDPGAGNGIVGVGWQLTGIPFITRVNYGNGIKYAAGDTYAHSQLGILVRQPDGTYRSKKESFAKFVQSGSCDDGPCSWTVTLPSGVKHYFGTTSSFRLAGLNSRERAWGFSSAVDLFGNSHEVTSYLTTTDGKLYPSVITYTKGPGIATAGYRTVEFEYESRTDTEPSYAQNVLEQMSKRLRSVSIKTAGRLVRKYRLDYECGVSTACASSETNRSRLIAVVEIGTDGTSELLTQRFAWQQGGGALDPSTTYLPPGTPQIQFAGRDGSAPSGWDFGVRTVDLDGDGRQDLIKGHYNYWGQSGDPSDRRAWLNKASGWEQNDAFAPPVDFAGRDSSAPGGFDFGLRFLDLNGDGRPDLIKGHYNYWGQNPPSVFQAWINDPANCAVVGQIKGCAWRRDDRFAPPVEISGRDSGAPGGWDFGVRILDLNGDGLPDLIKGHYNYGAISYGAWINNGGNCSTTGCAWTSAPAFVPPSPDTAGGRALFAGRDSSAPGGWDFGVRIVDLDGDGLPDLIKGHYNYGTQGYGAWLNTGTGWSFSSAYTLQGPYIAGREGSQPSGWDNGVRLVDVNGDGRPDFLQGKDDWNGDRIRRCWLNTGNGWLESTSFAPLDTFAARGRQLIISYYRYSSWDRGTLFIDVNGDGKPDLVRGHYEGSSPPVLKAWLNTGSGWQESDAYAPQAPLSGRDSGTPFGWDYGTRYVDMNGDGRSDLIQGHYNYGNTSEWAWTARGPFPDLLSRIDNGLGGSITVTYAAATQLDGAINPTSTSPGIPNTAPQQLATRVTTSDGRGGSFSSRYVYHDARWLPGTIPEQRNLGFGSVDAIDEQTGQFTRTYYNQSPGKEGTVAQVDAFTRQGLLVSRRTSTYDIVYPTGTCASTGTELVRERSQSASAYEFADPAFPQTSVLSLTQTTETDYDDCGNPWVKRQYADGLPTVVVTTTFSNDPVNWILGRVTEVKTTSGGVTLGWMQNTWNNTNNTITAKSEWLNTTSTWVTTTMTYYSNGDARGANGNLKTITEPWTGDGRTRTTTTEYDPTFKTYPAKVTNALGQATQRTYNDDGLVVTLTDSNGNVTATDWDVFGRKSKETRPDGGTTDYHYVHYGIPNATDPNNAQYNEVVTRLDATRSVWRREYFDGTGFKYEIRSSSDCGAYVAVSSEKDYGGRAYRNSQPYCAGAAPVWATTLYDDAGRPQFTNLPDNKHIEHRHGVNYSAQIDQNGHEMRKYFDARNRVAQIVDPANGSTGYGYDPLGRLTSITVDPNNITTISYDSLNRRTSVIDPRLGATTYAFDPAGNTTGVTSSGKTVSFTYDALNRVTMKQPQGETGIGYTYDEPGIANSIGRLTTVVDESGTTRYSYEPSGQIRAYTKSIDGSSFSQSFTYDLAGHVTHLTYPDGSYADYTYTDAGNLGTLSLNGAAFATWTAYDASGKPANVIYGNGVGTTYHYDDMGHLTSLSTVKGANTVQDLTYDWYSLPNTGGINVGSITDNRPNKIVGGFNTDETQWYEYDDLYRLAHAVGVWGDKSYGYDIRGNPTTFGGVVNRTLTFNGQQVTSGTGLADVTYDPAGNMVHKALDGTAWDYTWTTEGRLATASKNSLLAATMTYDAAGQRAKKVYSPATGPMVTTTYIEKMYEKRTYSDGSPERHTLYLYANGQLVASVTKSGIIITASNDANGWRAQWAIGSMYDGRTVKGAALKTFHSVRALAFHPLVRRWLTPSILALLALALIVVFARAMVGGLFSRRHSPVLRFAALSLALVFGLSACSRGGGLGSRLDRLLSGDTTQGLPTGTAFYHRNHINSSTVITDAGGNETTRMVYLPFGEISQPNSAGADAVTSKFTGQEFDEETGLYYYGSRYYDPAIGRFVSADSIVPSVTDAQSFNRYSYVRNNPIVYVDPSGHAFEFLEKAYHAAANAVHDIGDALAQAARWVGDKSAQFGQYLKNSADYAGMIVRAGASNPLMIASFVIAVALSVATLNPGPLIYWTVATAASISAQSMALAAGVRDPTVLSAIAVVAAVAAGGVSGGSWSNVFKAIGSWALNEGLTRLEGNRARDLAPLNALASFLIVNGLSKAFGPTPQPQDPGQQPLHPPYEDDAGSGGGEVTGNISTRVSQQTYVAELQHTAEVLSYIALFAGSLAGAILMLTPAAPLGLVLLGIGFASGCAAGIVYGSSYSPNVGRDPVTGETLAGP